VADSNSVTLGPNDRLVGQLYVEGDLRLGGTVEGQVEATGDVEVAQEANVKASVVGRGVSISGKVDGAVTAKDKLVVSRSGSLTGDVRVARLVIQDGARFSGNVSMGKAALNTREPAAEPAAGPEVAETALVAETAAEGQAEKPKAKKR
jgi:cytoskeletal protein CcmA (bactofilin family)